jgi:beta-glucosidase
MIALLSSAAFACCTPSRAAPQPAQPAVLDEARAKAAALVAQMTLDEKVDQLVNVAPAIPRLNIPAYNWWTESLHGGLGEVPTTNFPEPIGLAASFDAPLVHNVADAVSVEVRALHTRGRATGRLGKIGTGLDTWSPNINIFRDPRWGRGQETYGEDPFLTASLGKAFVTGMQGPDPDLPNVISTPKHFAVHSGPESTRHVADVFVSTHDLEDTYLPAFRAAIVEAHAGSVMCAYNRIDGQPACANDLLLKDHLRGAWGFQGYVVSDCDAVVDIADHHKYATDPAAAVAAALKAGVDNECNTQTLGGATGLGERYKEAYRRGLISMADIDEALVRLFSARLRNGDLPGLAERSPSQVPESEILTPAHRALALGAAEESLVLLKNDGILPLKPGLKILVIGPHGAATHVLRGNYSSSQSAPPISILDGLRQAMPKAKIVQAPFEPTLMDGDPVPETALKTPDGKPGLKVEHSGADEIRTGFLTPPDSGTWRIGLTGVAGELELDGKTVGKLETWHWGELPTLWTVPLEKGHRYRIRIVSKGPSMSGEMLMWKRVDAQWEDHLKAAAADADVIVAAVGLSSDLEGEESPLKVEGFLGGDKTSLDLPAPQRRLLEQAKALGKPLVVVLMNGSPLDLSWEKENAAAILEAWYPGQAGGLAVADVLSGKVDPAGRLPLTFYKSVADLPPFDDYAMKGRTYRYFEGKPVYPFGYGLSYTRFAYGAPTVEPVNGSFENGARVSVEVSNTGGRSGEEVAELYLKPPAFEGAPRLSLRGFQRLSLAAGEHKTVTFDLAPRDLSFVDRDGKRLMMTGRYEVSVGSGQPDTGVPVQTAAFSVGKAVSFAP